MSDNNSGSKLAIFLAGLGIGATVALLFAPKSGKETREVISRRAEQGKDYLESKGRGLQKQTRELVEKGAQTARDLAGAGKELVAKASR